MMPPGLKTNWIKRVAAGLLLAFVFYSSMNAQTFIKVTTPSLPALTNAKTQWVDFNNDGLPDLFISGTNAGGSVQTSIFTNNGNATFNLIQLTAMTDLSVDFGDYNNDGFIDIITAGVIGGGQKQTLIYKNLNGTSFSVQTFALAGLSRGGLLWSDLDSDGDLDIIVTGLDATSISQTYAYEFEGGTYNQRSTILPPVSNGQIKGFDKDRNGEPDVILTGLARNGTPITRIYSAREDFSFEQHAGTLEGTAYNSIAIGDLNSDGLEDLVITGLAGSELLKKTTVMENTAAGFTTISTTLINLSSSSADLGDLNNDGLLDLVLTGQDDATPTEFKHFRYYHNNGSFQFSNVPHSLKNIFNGDVSLADYDNDGDLDIFQIGNSDIAFEANILASDLASTVPDVAPSVPGTLNATVDNGKVELSWAAATDDHTATQSLTYNLYISSNPNGADLMVSPMTNITSGFRRYYTFGNTGTSTKKIIQNLPEGRYYWSVQTIDNNFRGSGFSAEQSFAICYDVDLGADTVVCYNEEFDLQMGEAVDVVNWYSKTNGLLQGNSNTFTLHVEENDTIVVELMKPYGCTVKDTLIVTMAPLPTINLGNDVSICYDQVFTRTLASYDSVNWRNPDGLLSANSNTYQFSVLEKDTIIAQVYSDFRCVNYDSIIVDVLPLPVFNIGGDQQICQGEEATLSASGTWPSISWKTLVSDVNISGALTYQHHVVQKDTVVAEVTDASGCVNYDSAIIDFHPLPMVILGSDRSICFNESTTLELPAGSNTINWYHEEDGQLATGTNSFTFQVSETTRIIAEVIDQNSCVNFDTIQLNRILLPQFDLGTEKLVCADDDILLQTGAGFARVDWFSKMHNSTLQEESWFYNHHVTETDTLIARVESAQGCVNYDSVKIIKLERPVFSLGDDLQICESEMVNLSVSGTWQEVNWYTTGNMVMQLNSPSLSFRLEEDIPVIAEVFHENGCVQYDTIQVIMQLLPRFDLGPDRITCYGDNIAFDVGNIGSTYNWFSVDGASLNTTQRFEFTAATTQKIFVNVVTGTGCTYGDSVVVAVNALPSFSILGESEVCSGATTSLRVAFPWQTIVWYRAIGDTLGVDVNELEIFVTQSTNVYAQVTDINQCKATQSFAIHMNGLPDANAGEDLLICFGEVATLGAPDPGSVALSYSWSPAETLNNDAIAQPIAAPESTTTYTVTVTDSNGCSDSDAVYVEVNPEIIVDAGANVAICLGDEIVIGGSPTASGSNFPFTYQWTSNTAPVESTSGTAIVAPTQTTTYSVFVTSGNCAVEYDSIVVTVNPLPEIIVSSDQSIGAGGNITLNASGAVEYTWSPAESLEGSQSSSPIAFPEVTTTYRVVGKDANGCRDSAEVVVVVQNNLFIPTLFTPNGDNSNDTFKLYGSGVATLVFSIFDQDGNRIYYTENVSEAFEVGWDGTSKGKAMKNDIYFWTIDGKFFNGQMVRYDGKSSGIIKLMR